MIALYLYKLCSKKSFLDVVNEKKTEACAKIHATLLDDVFSFLFFTFFKYLVKPLKTRHPARANCIKRKENHHRSSSSLDVSGQS